MAQRDRIVHAQLIAWKKRQAWQELLDGGEIPSEQMAKHEALCVPVQTGTLTNARPTVISSGEKLAFGTLISWRKQNPVELMIAAVVIPRNVARSHRWRRSIACSSVAEDQRALIPPTWESWDS